MRNAAANALATTGALLLAAATTAAPQARPPAQAPDVPAGAEVLRQYGRAAAAAKAIAGWLRQEGWEAEPVTGPMTGSVALIPPALACGFGELGKHGSIINPELGASFRLLNS